MIKALEIVFLFENIIVSLFSFARSRQDYLRICEALLIAIKRILHFNPFCKGGCDFVPEKINLIDVNTSFL